MATRCMAWRTRPPARQQAQGSLRGRRCGAPPTCARQPAARGVVVLEVAVVVVVWLLVLASDAAAAATCYTTASTSTAANYYYVHLQQHSRLPSLPRSATPLESRAPLGSERGSLRRVVPRLEGGIAKVSEGSGRLPALARPLWPVRAGLDERRTSVFASTWLAPRTLAVSSTLQRSSPPARLARVARLGWATRCAADDAQEGANGFRRRCLTGGGDGAVPRLGKGLGGRWAEAGRWAYMSPPVRSCRAAAIMEIAF
eukprot:scaffold91747_cov54-Phaeocystis_antarctica.AAC.2